MSVGYSAPLSAGHSCPRSLHQMLEARVLWEGPRVDDCAGRCLCAVLLAPILGLLFKRDLGSLGGLCRAEKHPAPLRPLPAPPGKKLEKRLQPPAAFCVFLPLGPLLDPDQK